MTTYDASALQSPVARFESRAKHADADTCNQQTGSGRRQDERSRQPRGRGLSTAGQLGGWPQESIACGANPGQGIVLTRRAGGPVGFWFRVWRRGGEKGVRSFLSGQFVFKGPRSAENFPRDDGDAAAMHVWAVVAVFLLERFRGRRVLV